MKSPLSRYGRGNDGEREKTGSHPCRGAQRAPEGGCEKKSPLIFRVGSCVENKAFEALRADYHPPLRRFLDDTEFRGFRIVRVSDIFPNLNKLD